MENHPKGNTMVQHIVAFLKNLFANGHVHKDSDRAGVVSDEEIRQRKANAVARNLVNF
jgi:hypothetical protein